MNIKLSKVILFSIIYVFFGSLYASAENENAEKKPNREFIKGFIEGAKLTDEEIMSQFEKLSSKELTDFEKRALRTRMGRKEVALPSTYYAGFCIPQNVSTEDVADDINRVINETGMDTLVGEKNSRGKRVYDALIALYPCAGK